MTWPNGTHIDGGARALGDRPVGRYDPAIDDVSPGRRLRVFAGLVFRGDQAIVVASRAQALPPLVLGAEGVSYSELLQSVDTGALADRRACFELIALRVGALSPLLTQVPEDEVPNHRDPDLHPALQDLGNEINEDIREALDTLDNPRAYYPGIDEGIEPVSDDHVRLVIWALQRELNRELRRGDGYLAALPPLPAAPLASLPWETQRALAERRRLRYKQWGLGREQWEQGHWDLWAVPEDPSYVPRRALRLAAIAHERRLAS